jgi:hypothetical protein
LSLALGVIGHLAAPTRAVAHDGFERLAPTAHPAVAGSDSRASTLAVPSNLMPTLADVQAVPSSADADSTSDGAAPADAPVDLDASDDVELDRLCEKHCGTVRHIARVPGVILEHLQELPVLGAFVVPVTRGVTIEPGEWLPALTFALAPTKIARGRGLVAIGRF